MSNPTIAVIPPKRGEGEQKEEEKAPDSLVYNTNEGAPSAQEAVDTSNDEAIAAQLAAEEASASPAVGGLMNSNYSVATCSSPWQYDDLNPCCYACGEQFHALNRRHHCRLCGNIFCHNCSNQRALIPPSRIVLHPMGGKKAKPGDSDTTASFSPDPDPDRMLTYIAAGSGNSDSEQLLYGKGLEERFKWAREPIRVCRPCHATLQPVQEELRRHNSHAVRFNHIDPTDAKRLFNSPLAFTLGHEIRKAAYTLNNLLPQPKRQSAVIAAPSARDQYSVVASEIQQCKEQCSGLSPNLGDLDGVRIPAVLLEQAKGVAVMTVVKGGFGLAGVEFGTGLVVARLPGDDNSNTASFRWSAPSAIGTAGLSWGALLGAQVSDHVFLLMTDAAVAVMFTDKASMQLGVDVGIAVGPIGRAVEGDWGADGNAAAPIYTYSLSKGLYAGISLDGKVIVTRPNVNERFYGCAVSAQEILAGAVPTPPAAQPLYEALQRCHVYASAAAGATQYRAARPPQESLGIMSEYGELLPGTRLPYSSLSGDHQSYAGMSDITSDL